MYQYHVTTQSIISYVCYNDNNSPVASCAAVQFRATVNLYGDIHTHTPAQQSQTSRQNPEHDYAELGEMVA